jgi:hypothetical protein
MLKFSRQVSLVGAALAVLVLSGAQPAAAAYVAIDLHPSGFTSSEALGVSGGQQVGFGESVEGGGPHALLWTGSAGSVVDLHPSGFPGSQGLGVSGGQQVGVGLDEFGNFLHALLWTGSAASVVDLHPSGFGDSGALGVSGGQQVGSGTGFDSFARLWPCCGQAARPASYSSTRAGFLASRKPWASLAVSRWALGASS